MDFHAENVVHLNLNEVIVGRGDTIAPLFYAVSRGSMTTLKNEIRYLSQKRLNTVFVIRISKRGTEIIGLCGPASHRRTQNGVGVGRVQRN